MGTAKRDRQRANRQLKVEQLIKEEKKAKTKRRGLQFVIGIPVLLILAFVLVKSLSKDTPTASTPTTVPATVAGTSPVITAAPVTAPSSTVPFAYGTGACANADGSSPETVTFTVAPKLCIDLTKSYTAKVETNKGTFTIALDDVNAPGNTNNFVTLARYHYYDNHDCHRIIANFVVQCGRPGDSSKETAPGYTVPDEAPTRNYKVGDIAMANTGSKNTGGGQFFIITGSDGANLPAQYSLVGSVTDGLETTVKAMAAAADPNAANGVPPKEEIKITKVTIIEGPANPATSTTTAGTAAGTTAAATTAVAATSAPADASTTPSATTATATTAASATTAAPATTVAKATSST